MTLKSASSKSTRKKRVPLRDVKSSVGNVAKDGKDEKGESVHKNSTVAMDTTSTDADKALTRPMRSKRAATSKAKYDETTDNEDDSSADDDSSVSHKITASKKSKGKGAPVNSKKVRKVAKKDDVSEAEPARISIIRNITSMGQSSPLGNSDWRSSFVIDY